MLGCFNIVMEDIKMIETENLGNKKLINSIKDEDYRKLVIRNGFCVGLLDFSEAVIEESSEDSWYHDKKTTRIVKITEYLELYKQTWSGESVEVTNDILSGDSASFEFKIDKSLKLDKRNLTGRAIKHMSILLYNSKDESSLTVEMSISNIYFNKYEIIEGIKLQYHNITRKFESMTWHRFWQNENDEYPTEFWVRLDLKSNRGEVYLDVNAKIRMIISLM